MPRAGRFCRHEADEGGVPVARDVADAVRHRDLRRARLAGDVVARDVGEQGRAVLHDAVRASARARADRRGVEHPVRPVAPSAMLHAAARHCAGDEVGRDEHAAVGDRVVGVEDLHAASPRRRSRSAPSAAADPYQVGGRADDARRTPPASRARVGWPKPRACKRLVRARSIPSSWEISIVPTLEDCARISSAVELLGRVDVGVVEGVAADIDRVRHGEHRRRRDQARLQGVGERGELHHRARLVDPGLGQVDGSLGRSCPSARRRGRPSPGSPRCGRPPPRRAPFGRGWRSSGPRRPWSPRPGGARRSSARGRSPGGAARRRWRYPAAARRPARRARPRSRPFPQSSPSYFSSSAAAP